MKSVKILSLGVVLACAGLGQVFAATTTDDITVTMSLTGAPIIETTPVALSTVTLTDAGGTASVYTDGTTAVTGGATFVGGGAAAGTVAVTANGNDLSAATLQATTSSVVLGTGAGGPNNEISGTIGLALTANAAANIGVTTALTCQDAATCTAVVGSALTLDGGETSGDYTTVGFTPGIVTLTYT